jgi:hypothetical protein
MLNYFSNDHKVFANGKELVLFEYDQTGLPVRAIVMESFFACSYSVEKDPIAVDLIGGPNFLMPGWTAARLELVSHGPLRVEQGRGAVQLEQRLQAAWSMSVSDLLKIVYQKMEERDA